MSSLSNWPKSRLLRLAAILVIFGALGCATNAPLPAHGQSPHTQAGGADSRDAASRAGEGGVPPMTASLAGANFTYSDPRTGKLLWTARADSVRAQTGVGANSAVGDLHNVVGTMYRDGIASDDMRATDVTADQSTRTVVATGDVFVSTIGPNPTTMHCDRMVWAIDRDTIVGAGNAVCRRGGLTQSAPSFEADTRMRSVVMPAPAAQTTARGTIRARILGNGLLTR
jgi:hypothetical protein